MKGTIDINITRKDGTTEHRQEHNVVFDIPAIALKKSLEHPEISRVFQGGVGYYSGAYNPGNEFQYFGLSEDTMDLTAPEFRPITLRCVSGTASKWYDSAITRTVEDKKITVQATWTAQSALTLKSIGFISNSPGYSISDFVADSNSSYNHLFDGHLYPRQYYSPANRDTYNTNGASIYDLNLRDFKFTNNYLGGLKGKVNPTKVHVIPYELANPDERAAFTSTTFEKSPYQYSTYINYSSGTVYYNRLCIYNKNDVETPLRYFDLSQFEGALNPNYSTTFFIVNTGTKNYLMQVITANSTKHVNVWQIPDAAVEASASIPLLSSQSLTDAFAGVATLDYMVVIGNYVLIMVQGGWYWVQISDDLSAKTYSGYAAHQTATSNALSNTPTFRYVSKNESGVQLCTFSSSSMYLPNPAVYYTNSTAANFSTPIVLAEGDVLTVSYTIEVA